MAADLICIDLSFRQVICLATLFAIASGIFISACAFLGSLIREATKERRRIAFKNAMNRLDIGSNRIRFATFNR